MEAPTGTKTGRSILLFLEPYCVRCPHLWHIARSGASNWWHVSQEDALDVFGQSPRRLGSTYFAHGACCHSRAEYVAGGARTGEKVAAAQTDPNHLQAVRHGTLFTVTETIVGRSVGVLLHRLPTCHAHPEKPSEQHPILSVRALLGCRPSRDRHTTRRPDRPATAFHLSS
jgi:hypothetical protein